VGYIYDMWKEDGWSMLAKAEYTVNRRKSLHSIRALTLMKPPSGSARRKAGCGLILGWRSCTDSSFLKRGTGPLPSD